MHDGARGRSQLGVQADSDEATIALLYTPLLFTLSVAARVQFTAICPCVAGSPALTTVYRGASYSFRT